MSPSCSSPEVVAAGHELRGGVGGHDGEQARAFLAELQRRLAFGSLAGERPGGEHRLRGGVEPARIGRPAERLHLGGIALHAHVGRLGDAPDMDVVFLRAGGDELAVGAPFQRDVAARPGKAARRQGHVADAPHRDAAIVGGRDAAAVLAEVEGGDGALVRPELARAPRLVDHQRHLADRRRDHAVVAVRGELVDPLALLVGDLGRAAVRCDAQQAAVVAAAQKAVARGIGDQRQHGTFMDRLARFGGGVLDVRRQQAHAAVAQRESGELAVAAEGAGDDRRVGRDRARRRQRAPPVGIARSSFKGSHSRGAPQAASRRVGIESAVRRPTPSRRIASRCSSGEVCLLD